MNEEFMMQGLRSGEQSLQHYGVKGMKWGVRKNPDLAANRAIKKLQRLDKSSQRLHTKSVKTNLRAAKLTSKANKLQLKAMKTVRNKKRIKLEGKAIRLNNKAIKKNVRAAKYDARSVKKAKKGRDWAKQMNKYLSNQTYSNVSKESIAYARKWAVSAFDD